MSSSKFPMMRYKIDPRAPLLVNLAVCVQEYIKHYGCPPTLAHVSMALQNVPTQIGPIRIEQSWGVFPHEMDLGTEPIAAPTIHELPVATVEKPQKNHDQSGGF